MEEMSKEEFVKEWRKLPRKWLISVGVPVRTVDDYRAGTSQPLPWARYYIVAALKAEQDAATKSDRRGG